MSIVVSDLSERLDTLTKLVLAEPVARIGHSRVTVRPLTLRGKAFFQLEYQQGGMNPASLVRLGRQTGAGYMLYGDLLSEGGRYRLAMSLMDLKSGELLWNASRSAAR